MGDGLVFVKRVPWHPDVTHVGILSLPQLVEVDAERSEVVKPYTDYVQGEVP